jgi:hypothetical protein
MSGNRFEISSKLKGMRFMKRAEGEGEQQQQQQQQQQAGAAGAAAVKEEQQQQQPNMPPDISLSAQQQTPAAAAAAGATPGSGKFSGNLSRMKFMQRAAERQKMEEGVQQQDDKYKEVRMPCLRPGAARSGRRARAWRAADAAARGRVSREAAWQAGAARGPCSGPAGLDCRAALSPLPGSALHPLRAPCATSPSTTPPTAPRRAGSFVCLQMHSPPPPQPNPTQPPTPAQMQWTIKNPATKCVVIAERDPLPGAACGRMSFGSFNEATERIQAEQEALAAGLPMPKKQQAEEVSDADMARALGKRKGEEEGGLLSLRQHKKQRR